jgi:NTP pyrophosphatase (non-canonical NTP hydrolase)
VIGLVRASTQKQTNELQGMVAAYSKRTGRKLSLPYRALDLCAEVGELAQEILRDSGYGKNKILKPSEKTVEEFGDSLFSLLCMANEMDLDIMSALKSTLEKYESRELRS